MVYNTKRGKGKKAMRPDAFIPKEREDKNEKQDLDNPNFLHKILEGRVRVKEKKKK